MNKVKYYAGFNRETKPYVNGYMVINAMNVNDAKHILKILFPGCRELPMVLTESQMNRLTIEEFCDAPAICRGEYSIYKEKSENVWCNIRMNVVFNRYDGIITAGRVEMAGGKDEEVQNS